MRTRDRPVGRLVGPPGDGIEGGALRAAPFVATDVDGVLLVRAAKPPELLRVSQRGTAEMAEDLHARPSSLEEVKCS
jgi:hypothetical protein